MLVEKHQATIKCVCWDSLSLFVFTIWEKKLSLLWLPFWYLYSLCYYLWATLSISVPSFPEPGPWGLEEKPFKIFVFAFGWTPTHHHLCNHPPRDHSLPARLIVHEASSELGGLQSYEFIQHSVDGRHSLMNHHRPPLSLAADGLCVGKHNSNRSKCWHKKGGLLTQRVGGYYGKKIKELTVRQLKKFTFRETRPWAKTETGKEKKNQN